MPRSTDEQHLLDRRVQFIQAATRCFASKGYHATTVHDIASEADVADGTLYRHFKSKKDLLLSFIEGAAAGPLMTLLVPDAEASDEDIVRNFFSSRLATASHNRDLLKVVFGEAIFDQDMASALYEKILRPAHQALTEYAQQRIEDGAFRPLDPQIVGPLMASMVFGYFLLWQVIAPDTSASQDVETIVDNLKEVFLHGLATSS